MQASSSGSARIALIGSPTHEGKRLREALAAIGLPGSRIDLYAIDEGEAQIGEYAGEARLIQPATPEEIARHDLVFLCEPGEQARRAAEQAVRLAAAVVDL